MATPSSSATQSSSTTPASTTTPSPSTGDATLVLREERTSGHRLILTEVYERSQMAGLPMPTYTGSSSTRLAASSYSTPSTMQVYTTPASTTTPSSSTGGATFVQRREHTSGDRLIVTEVFATPMPSLPMPMYTGSSYTRLAASSSSTPLAASSSSTQSSSATPASSTGKTSWPELDGKDAKEAVEVIKRENPSLEIILSLDQTETGSSDFEKAEFSWVYFDGMYEVTHTPTFGKTSWPELVGKDPFYAAYVIHKGNSNLNVMLEPNGLMLTRVPSRDRIRVWIGLNNKVVETPIIETHDFRFINKFTMMSSRFKVCKQ